MHCGQKMEALVPDITDAATEKHLSFVTVEDGAICGNVGEVTHPTTDEHYMQWGYVETENGGVRRACKPGDASEITFCVGEDTPIAVYAYCNNYGL